MEVPGFSNISEYVPHWTQIISLTTIYSCNFSWVCLQPAGMIQGYHGTGKSTHIEQVAAKLNPCLRINLDSHISRIDLIGKDAIVLKNGKQVTEFKACCLGIKKSSCFSL